MNRRALIGGGLCAAAAVLAYELKPHRYVSLLSNAKLDSLIPRSFGNWTSQDVGDPLALNAPGTLSSKLYNQLVTRSYADGHGRQLLMLLAHGERQSDELQLHRPEVCYPAFGYKLLRNDPAEVTFNKGVQLPARRLIARSTNDEERVVYWTRLGEFFPTSVGDQRRARFNNTVAGIIPDGLLCRFSTANAPESEQTLSVFLRDLLTATGDHGRRVLVGTERSQQLARAA